MYKHTYILGWFINMILRCVLFVGVAACFSSVLWWSEIVVVTWTCVHIYTCVHILLRSSCITFIKSKNVRSFVRKKISKGANDLSKNQRTLNTVSVFTWTFENILDLYLTFHAGQSFGFMTMIHIRNIDTSCVAWKCHVRKIMVAVKEIIGLRNSVGNTLI